MKSVLPADAAGRKRRWGNWAQPIPLTLYRMLLLGAVVATTIIIAILLTHVSEVVTQQRAVSLLSGTRLAYVVGTALAAVLALVLANMLRAQHRADEARQGAEYAFRNLFQRNPVPMWVYDRETQQFLEVNGAAIEKYGYTHDEFLAMRIMDIRPAEDLPRLAARLAENPMGLSQSGPWRHITRSGELIDVRIHSDRITFSGRPAALVAVHDVTEIEAAAMALRQSNQRLTEAVSELTVREDTIRRHAERQRLLNSLARDVSGTLDLAEVLDSAIAGVLATSECARCSVGEYDAEADVVRLRAGWRRDGTRDAEVGVALPASTSVAGEPVRSRKPVVVDVRTRVLHPAGQRAFQGMEAIVCLPIFVGERVWGVLHLGFTEMSQADEGQVEFLSGVAAQLGVAIRNAELYRELRAAHEDLQRSQQHVIQQERLGAIGRMASGIAHDLNNALAPVVGFSELLLRNADALSPGQREWLQLVHTGASDAAGVVARMREVYRPREATHEYQPVDLSALAEQVVALTRPKWKDDAQAVGRRVDVTLQLEALPPVLGDAAELRDALTNLVFNAVDAISTSGTITIRTYTASGAPAGISAGELQAHAVLEVSDTGSGMSEDERQRCMEPFFTTKGERGTGLGLSMVHSTMARHKGSLEVVSTLHVGTTMRLLLPLAKEYESTSGAGAGPAEAPPPTPLRVLVVDDEPAVRAVVTAFLEADGHVVDPVDSSSEAIQRIGSGGEYDVMITDRAMPGLSGEALAVWVKQHRPAMPVIMVTGYGELMNAAGECPDGVDVVLPKPVSFGTLRRALVAIR